MQRYSLLPEGIDRHLACASHRKHTPPCVCNEATLAFGSHLRTAVSFLLTLSFSATKAMLAFDIQPRDAKYCLLTLNLSASARKRSLQASVGTWPRFANRKAEVDSSTGPMKPNLHSTDAT